MSGYGLAAGAVISAIGAGTNMYAQNQNAKNQDKQLAANIQQEQNLEQQGAAKVAQTTAKAASQNPNTEGNQLLARYKQALSAASPMQSGAVTSVPGGSKRYAESAASARGNIANYADTMAKNMAATGGAQLSRIDTGNDIANTASNLGLINNQAANATGVLNAQLKGDTANPWLTALGSIAQGAGQGLMGRSLAGSMGAKPMSTTVAPGFAAGGTDVPSVNLSGAGASNPYLA